eukprot:CAMPEP_0194699556 /NCGR_PEP_ID=MMETSP0295-20121207/24905_1 /TAXON_ID=39354 /ORGANISM="Heterosigma akashiwo, Strain CCMP2393" /LENGTH=43 /DNA_ID= /DNA_START= /DNA_END= /DNA_ORIENTATION=
MVWPSGGNEQKPSSMRRNMLGGVWRSYLKENTMKLGSCLSTGN